MTIELKRPWQFIDASDKAKCKERRVKVEVPAGRHEVKVISPNPWVDPDPTKGFQMGKGIIVDPNYVVLPGTIIGLSLEYLRSFAGEEHGISQVIIED